MWNGNSWQRAAATKEQFNYWHAEAWHHLRMEMDNVARYYNVYLGDMVVAVGVPFTPDESVELELQAGFFGSVSFDDIQIEALSVLYVPETDFTLDSDGAGIPDYWERVLAEIRMLPTTIPIQIIPATHWRSATG